MATIKRQAPKQVQNKLKKAAGMAKSSYKTGFEVDVNKAANKGKYRRPTTMSSKQLATAKSMQKQRATEMGRAATRANKVAKKAVAKKTPAISPNIKIPTWAKAH